ncbi:hypothetical protein [Synechococcus elongatus]|uniref:hypothetical protein n=1 Tax=Synechococcus elongatus TaxID=32046 RepID=UPI0030CBD5DD
MKFESIICNSEPFTANGNLAAEGVRKLLGTPNVSALETLVRETAQNSWDARLRHLVPTYQIRVRYADSIVKSTLQQFFRGRPPIAVDEPIGIALGTFLKQEKMLLMEISDFNTIGLSGPVRADIPLAENETANFVNFLRNIGSARDIHLGGGTYGFGKSAIYAFSRCQTLIVDTLTLNQAGQPERRIIAAAIGQQFRTETQNYTGRHWWGIDDSGTVVPITGIDAEELAKHLGLPKRNTEDTGTTLVILDPRLEDLQPSQDESEQSRSLAGPIVLGDRLSDILLWHFWPKWVPDSSGKNPMEFRIEILGESVEIPSPLAYPPLNLLAQSLQQVRQRHDGDKISSERPKKLLGHLAITEDFFSFTSEGRLYKSLGEESLIPKTLSHIALMRPAELVVRYQVGQVNPENQRSWGGVFVCSEEAEVEEAFASAEPPAHDDWISDSLTRPAKTYVNVALKRIKERCDQQSGRGSSIRVDNLVEGPSVAALSSQIGKLLLGFGNSPAISPSKVTPQSVTKKRTTPKQLQISPAVAVGTRLTFDGCTVTFQFSVHGPSGLETRLSLEPLVVIEGSTTDKTAPNGKAPELLALNGPNPNAWEAKTQQLAIRCNGELETWEAEVSVPDYVAITLEVQEVRV